MTVARDVKWQPECGLEFVLTLHTQENAGKRDKLSSSLGVVDATPVRAWRFHGMFSVQGSS
jgi:hypothetical protein